jgi:peptide/nickel transport system permease protein
MSESRTPNGTATTGPAEDALILQDRPSPGYWERTLRDFSRNKLAMISVFMVFLVATIGVFCPLIASQRPLAIKMVFADDYEEAFFVALDYVRRLSGENPATRAQDEQLLARAFNRMAPHLSEGHRARFDELSNDLLVGLGMQGGTATLKLEEALAAFENEMDTPAVKLIPLTRFPAVRALSQNEVMFMAFYFSVIALFFVRRRLPGGGWIFIATVLVCTGVATTAWMTVFPAIQDTVPYRRVINSDAFRQSGDWWVIKAPVPFGENENITAESRQPPTWLLPVERRVEGQNWRWLGTDTNGRDVLARMVYGARISMLIGLVAVSIYVTIGTILGALAGYYGGWMDLLMSRILEIVICLPVLFLILSVQAFLRPNIINIMVLLGLVWWTGPARLTRGEFLRIVNMEYVQAVRAIGGSDLRIIFLHVMPNAVGPILVSVSFGMAGSILVESTLSFLGFGVPPPTASWGDLLNNGRGDIQALWWLTFFPGLAIFLTLTCFNLIGDGLRDALDPRRKSR